MPVVTDLRVAGPHTACMRVLLLIGAAATVTLGAGAVAVYVRRLAFLARTARASALQARADLALLNEELGSRLAAQADEGERQALLRPHRREIAVLFFDLRSFTAFAESSQPEDVLHVLDEYFDVLGQSVRKHGATVGAFTGDGLMAFFNDPVPCADPAIRAITMATEVQATMEVLLNRWRPRGYELGLGVGIALGYADIGMIGFEGRRDYTAIGTVVNLASRLCDEARPGEILIDERTHRAAHDVVQVNDSALITLKGLREPVLAISAELSSLDGHVAGTIARRAAVDGQ